MIVNLSISLKIDTDKLELDEREHFGQEVEFAGFPINDENIAWYLAQEIADGTDAYGQPYRQAVRAEVEP